MASAAAKLLPLVADLLSSPADIILETADDETASSQSPPPPTDESTRLLQDEGPPSAYSSTTERDDDATPQYAADASPLTTTTSFWIISIVICACLAFILVLFCKRYGADLVEGWVGSRASGNLSEANYISRLVRRREEEEEAKKECPEKRMGRLARVLEKEGVVMTVKESDFISQPTSRSAVPKHDEDLESGLANEEYANAIDDAAENGNSSDDIDLNTSQRTMSTSNAPAHIYLPPAPNGSRQVPNCCAICLCPYEINDTLIWSSNPSCQHAFHKECLIEWLGKMQDGAPCPCCRQTFVELPEHLDEDSNGRKRLNSEMTRASSFAESDAPAFNVNRISLR